VSQEAQVEMVAQVARAVMGLQEVQHTREQREVWAELLVLVAKLMQVDLLVSLT
jgi:hypothetical protein